MDDTSKESQIIDINKCPKCHTKLDTVIEDKFKLQTIKCYNCKLSGPACPTRSTALRLFHYKVTHYKPDNITVY